MKVLLIVLAVLILLYIFLPYVLRMVIVPASDVVTRVVRESEEMRPATGVVHKDLNYSNFLHPRLTLDIYEPLVEYEPGQAPIVVFFHGGSWLHGDKVTIRIIDRFLNRMRSAGYFVAAVNYVAPLWGGLKAPYRNSLLSVRWLMQNAGLYGYAPGKIGLYGISAGGHLALMVESELRDESVVSFVLAECAPSDLLAMAQGEAFSSSAILNLFPESYLKSLSPVDFVSADMAPVLIYHGDADEIVHVDQSIRLHQAIQQAGAHSELEIYENGTHAFLGMSDELWYRQESRALIFMAEQFD